MSSLNKIAIFAENEKRLENNYLFRHLDNSNPYVDLVNDLRNIGFDVNTLDIFKNKCIDPDLCIFLDTPKLNINTYIDHNKTKSMVLLREPDIILPDNFNLIRHREFNYILTWKNKFVDDNKYFYLPSAKFKRDNNCNRINFFEKKLCTLINSNLSLNIPGELYSKRLEIIEWFEDNSIDDFDLYGWNWDKKIIKLFNKKILSYGVSKNKRKSYKGSTNDKIKTLSAYKFSICFENTFLIEDYVSEKIFDCFLAGCVPIYYGDPNILKKIPSECFIDYRMFSSIDEMYRYIRSIDENTYSKFQDAIYKFITSDKSENFSLNQWKRSIINVILKAIKLE